MEIFKDIPNYEGSYQVSDLGNVKSLRYGKERILKPATHKSGYLHLGLRKDCKRKDKNIHQLVAESFLNHVPCGTKLVVNHINFNKHDNRIENLELVTSRENGNLKHINSTSEYTGVCWDKLRKKWKASISINGNTKYLGSFTCEKEASEAYQFKLKNI